MGREALETTQRAQDLSFQFDQIKSRAATRYLAHGGIQKSALQKLHESIRIHPSSLPAGFVNSDLEEDAAEIEGEQGAAAAAFTEGVQHLGGRRPRKKHPVLVEDVAQPFIPEPMGVDALAHVMAQKLQGPVGSMDATVRA